MEPVANCFVYNTVILKKKYTVAKHPCTGKQCYTIRLY